ncbi:hypothetical protein SLA2020_371870 [Shorea laevis]
MKPSSSTPPLLSHLLVSIQTLAFSPLPDADEAFIIDSAAAPSPSCYRQIFRYDLVFLLAYPCNFSLEMEMEFGIVA